MFVAMNRFQINPERGAEFEEVWKARDSYLSGFDGFIHFALLKGDEPGDYVSHSIWETRDNFLDWTRSEAFRRAHGMGLQEGVVVGHPKASMYAPVDGTEVGTPITTSATPA